jgi:hypothetical protein
MQDVQMVCTYPGHDGRGTIPAAALAGLPKAPGSLSISSATRREVRLAAGTIQVFLISNGRRATSAALFE